MLRDSVYALQNCGNPVSARLRSATLFLLVLNKTVVHSCSFCGTLNAFSSSRIIGNSVAKILKCTIQNLKLI